MDEYSGNVLRASTYSPLPTRERARETIGQVREVSSNGVMEEGSETVQKVSAHHAIIIVVDVAVVEIHFAAPDGDSSTLPNKEANGHGNVIQRGDG